MRMVLRERAIHNGHGNLTSHSRPETKISGNVSRDRRSTNTTMDDQFPETDDHSVVESGLQITGRMTRPDGASVVTAKASNPIEFITKSKMSLKGPRDRRLRKILPQCGTASGANDAMDFKRLPAPPPFSLKTDPPPQEAAVSTRDPGEDTDSDLSDTEKHPGPPSVIGPPPLQLRAEALGRCDFRASPPPSQGQRRTRDGYPDFLPPPFNCWSLRQLAVYLNTDGRGVPRPRPTSQLERYLERLLQLEWHQIQSVQEEGSKPSAPSCAGLHRPQAMPPCSLSAPRSILHCPRAFPLTLLSSLADVPPGCTGHVGDSACRSHLHPRCSHSSPLPEGRRRAAVPPRRSSSETRTRPVEHVPAPRRHRLSDPLGSGSHLKRMQAIGNIRNPAASPCSTQYVAGTMNLEAGALSRRDPVKAEGRSLSCGDMREEGNRQARTGHTAHKPSQQVGQGSESSSSGKLQGSIDSVAHKTAGKQKRVEFVIT